MRSLALTVAVGFIVGVLLGQCAWMPSVEMATGGPVGEAHGHAHHHHAGEQAASFDHCELAAAAILPASEGPAPVQVAPVAVRPIQTLPPIRAYESAPATVRVLPSTPVLKHIVLMI